MEYNSRGPSAGQPETPPQSTLENDQKRFYNLMLQAPVGMAILYGHDFFVELANDYYLRLLGRDQRMIGRPLWESLPEVRHQGFDRLMRLVLDTGIPYRSNGHRVEIMRTRLETIYVDFVYEPMKDLDGTINRIMVVVIDVTEQVMARQRIEDAEERARLAVEAAQLGTFDYNMLTGDVVTSPRFDAIFGLTSAGEHRNYVDRIHRDDLAVREAAHARALVDGVFFYESRVIWPDASEHWVRVQGKAYLDKEGKPYRLLGTVLDITEERKAEEALTRTAQRFNLALLAGKMGSYELLLPEGSIICTDQHKRNFGLPPDASFDYTLLLSLIVPEDRKATETAIAEALATNSTYSSEYRVNWPDGSLHWIFAAGLPVYNMEGKPVSMAGVTADITERKLFTESLERNVRQRTHELDESNQQLRRTNAELEQFAYVASHDLQEPLRKVRTFIELLQNGLTGADERTRSLLDKIAASSARMLTLIRDVLNFSQLSADETLYKQTDLNEIVDRVREDFELLIGEKGAVVTAGKLPRIEGIPMQLNQLFSNLISNALKFSVAGRPPRIEINAERVSPAEAAANPELDQELSYWRICFADNGIGFAQEHAHQIFTIFQRLHDRQSYSGTGIGLALCKKIVENHGGDIYARSSPGTGSLFCVLLPETMKARPERAE